MMSPASHALRRLLRAEGLLVCLAGLWLFEQTSGRWLWALPAFLLPDLAILAYGVGRRFGTTVYNILHSYLAAAFLFLAGLCELLPADVGAGLAALWLAHIGFDRALGYGLKLPTGFFDTHLGPIGPAARRARSQPERADGRVAPVNPAEDMRARLLATGIGLPRL